MGVTRVKRECEVYLGGHVGTLSQPDPGGAQVLCHAQSLAGECHEGTARHTPRGQAER